MAFAASDEDEEDEEDKCMDAAKKISDDVDAHASKPRNHFKIILYKADKISRDKDRLCHRIFL